MQYVALALIVCAVLLHAHTNNSHYNHPTFYLDGEATLHVNKLDGAGSSGWSFDVPFWPHYPTRTVQVLDGDWYFGYADNWNISAHINASRFAALTPNRTYVPSNFDAKMPGIAGPRGTAFYRAYVNTSKGHDLWIYFSACSFYCQLYVDGVYVGDHAAGGYGAFAFHINQTQLTISVNIDDGTHELFVVSDNRFLFASAPAYSNGGDWYFYGGIQRSMLVHTLPNDADTNHLHHAEVFPTDIHHGVIDVNVSWMAPFVNTQQPLSLALTFDGNPSSTLNLPCNLSTSHSFQWCQLSSVRVPNSKIWSLSHPNLHTLTVAYAADAIEVRFGLRKVGIAALTTSESTAGKNGDSIPRLTLNDEIIKFKGFGRHTTFGDSGAALSYDQVQLDFQLILESGANFIRGCCYPQDQRLLDLCDEHGIAVWAELLGCNATPNLLNNSFFMQMQVQQLHEMVDVVVNNPSVLFYAFFNEGASDENVSIASYQMVADAFRARDDTRLVSFATNKYESDVCVGPVADFVSYNAYPSWYQHNGDVEYASEYWTDAVKAAHAKWPDKPFFISETGAAAFYEWDNATSVKWSQLYQSQVLYADVVTALNNSMCSGISVWQFCDSKADDGDTRNCGGCQYYEDETLCEYIAVNCSRPAGENHKGQVDLWRRVKQSFNTVQQLMSSFNETSAEVLIILVRIML